MSGLFSTLIFFYKQGKKTFQPPLCLYFLLFFSIVLPIVLQSNLQPNYAYRRYAYKKKCMSRIIPKYNFMQVTYQHRQ